MKTILSLTNHMKHALALINPKSKLLAAEITLMKIAGISVSVSVAISSLALTGCLTTQLVGWYLLPSADEVGRYTGVNKRAARRKLKHYEQRIVQQLRDRKAAKTANFPIIKPAGGSGGLRISGGLRPPGPIPPTITVPGQGAPKTSGGAPFGGKQSRSDPGGISYESWETIPALFKAYDDYFRSNGYSIVDNSMPLGNRTYHTEAATAKLSIRHDRSTINSVRVTYYWGK